MLEEENQIFEELNALHPVSNDIESKKRQPLQKSRLVSENWKSRSNGSQKNGKPKLVGLQEKGGKQTSNQVPPKQALVQIPYLKNDGSGDCSKGILSILHDFLTSRNTKVWYAGKKLCTV